MYFLFLRGGRLKREGHHVSQNAKEHTTTSSLPSDRVSDPSWQSLTSPYSGGGFYDEHDGRGGGDVHGNA